MAGCHESLATRFALLGTVGALRAAVSKDAPFKSFKPPVLSPIEGFNPGFGPESVQDVKTDAGSGRSMGSVDCLGRLGEPFIHFFLEGEELLDARAFLHALEMGADVGEA
jgi:hypothetical protein